MSRSVISIDDLDNHEIESIFRLADQFLADQFLAGKSPTSQSPPENSPSDRSLADSAKPYRVRGRRQLARDHILATLFYEPSTRTRLSFESAMLRLGGQVISSADASSSSAAKGETIADTVRIIENYADVMVIRHPSEGAAQVAAEYTDVPVINGGDGGHEHPTQTLCDLYTIRAGQRERHPEQKDLSLRNVNIEIRGDLKHGRTVHSLVYALARFGARIIPTAAPGCDLPPHVCQRLARDYNCFPLNRGEIEGGADETFPQFVYVTPEGPHQRTLWTAAEANIWFQLSPEQRKSLRQTQSVDFCYATRYQKERHDAGGNTEAYPPIDSELLKDPRYRQTHVMHPLPRVDELSYELDHDPRGVYFKQAAYGVPVRMALIAALLELQPAMLARARPSRYRAYGSPTGIRCANARCVTRDNQEKRYLTPKFWIVDETTLTLRCIYCDFERDPRLISRNSTRKYTFDVSEWREIYDRSPQDLVVFATEEDALDAGHSPRRSKKRSGAQGRGPAIAGAEA